MKTTLELGKSYLLKNGKIFTPDELTQSHYPIGGIVTNTDGSKDRIASYTLNGIYDVFNIESNYNVLSEIELTPALYYIQEYNPAVDGEDYRGQKRYIVLDPDGFDVCGEHFGRRDALKICHDYNKSL